MTHGFDLTSSLVCEGIIGDGCGGGRIFFIENETLFIHDSMTNENIELLKEIYMPRSIRKDGCVIVIECKEKKIKFDLSSLKKV